MIVAKFNCSQVLVTDGCGNFAVADISAPWIQDPVDTSPPEDEEVPHNVWPIRCQCRHQVA